VSSFLFITHNTWTPDKWQSCKVGCHLFLYMYIRKGSSVRAALSYSFGVVGSESAETAAETAAKAAAESAKVTAHHHEVTAKAAAHAHLLNLAALRKCKE